MAYTVYSGIKETDTVAESVTERFLTEKKKKKTKILCLPSRPASDL